jgi:hypothetical protein
MCNMFRLKRKSWGFIWKYKKKANNVAIKQVFIVWSLTFIEFMYSGTLLHLNLFIICAFKLWDDKLEHIVNLTLYVQCIVLQCVYKLTNYMHKFL